MFIMKEETVSLLRSPVTHNSLVLQRDALSEFLLDNETRQKFVVLEGIPALIEQSQVVLYNRKYQKFYNRVAPLYDATLRLGAKFARKSVDAVRMEYIEELELESGYKLLDVSTGTGANLKYIPEDVLCYGLDISRGMLRKCQKNLKKWQRPAELFLGNAEALPFKDGQFDSVIHVGGINAFNDRAKALTEMVRVAKPGTKIVVADETANLINKISWFPGAKRMLKKYGDRFEAPVSHLPDNVTDIKVKDVMDGSLYCLSFRKL